MLDFSKTESFNDGSNFGVFNGRVSSRLYFVLAFISCFLVYFTVGFISRCVFLYFNLFPD